MDEHELAVRAYALPVRFAGRLDPADFDGRTIPAGMEGAVLEVLPDGTCLVELAFRPQTADRDGDFALAELAEGQYEIIAAWPASGYDH